MNANTPAARILVVDDEDVLRDMLGDALRLSGFEVLEAADGSKALTLLQKEAVDLIVSDVNMPGMDGTETLQRIRAMPGRTRLAVIAMTADATEEHRRRYLAAGMDGYLAKPLTPESVAEMLARYAPAVR